MTGRKALDSSPLTTANQEATYDDKASSSTYEIGSAPPLSQTSKRNFHSRCASIGSHQIGRKGADGGLCRSQDSEEQKLICYMVRLRKRWHAGHGGDSVEQTRVEHRSRSQQRRDRRRCPRSRDRALSRSLSLSHHRYPFSQTPPPRTSSGGTGIGGTAWPETCAVQGRSRRGE